ncbi:MAG TPA: glutamate racemase, partial [Zunongwangia profunda]|nr:glutamate racemase [Zunongwangia profunda]
MNKNSIGIFDSGIGGTSIWREIHELLPFEDTVYLA